MNQQHALTLENIIYNWNTEFTHYELTAADLKNPHRVMGALFEMFKRLGIDVDIIVAPPENQNENFIYYMDLLPVINTIRVFNHIMPHFGITMLYILQPTATTSRSILLLLINLMMFNEERMRVMAPYEDELFAEIDRMKGLEEKKNKMLEMLNEQAQEKGKRAENFDKIDKAIKQYEEDFKQDKELHKEEIQELEGIRKEIKQADAVVEQKKSVRDALMEKLDKKRALRVYDVDELITKVEKAKQDVHDAQEHLYSLQIILMEKETILKHLHTTRPNLDIADPLICEIELCDKLEDNDSGDLETDSSEEELYVLTTEENVLRANLSELKSLHAEEEKIIAESLAQRQQERTVLQSLVLEAEEKDKYLPDLTKSAVDRIKEIKEEIVQFNIQKQNDSEVLTAIQDKFCTELKAAEEMLLNKANEIAKRIEDKLRNGFE